MQDNRWLYFIVGGLAVVALIFFGLNYDAGSPSGDGASQVQTEATQPAAPPAGTAAGESDDSGSSSSITIEQKRE